VVASTASTVVAAREARVARTVPRRREELRNRGPIQRACLSITREQRHRVHLRDRYRCVDCGATADLTLDHDVPLAVEVKAS
jgi:5-methylcytosine-specific restriction endonuclease McrA